MGFEARKTSQIRDATFAQTYLSGTVLDIGCGPDLVVPSAQPFDLEHGDAQQHTGVFFPGVIRYGP